MTRLDGRGRRALYRVVNERTAIPLSTTLVIVAGVGDWLTTADVAFTLLYLLPIAITAWFRGARRAFPLVVLAVAFSVVVEKGEHGTLAIVAWNVGGEALLFVVFAQTLSALRSRIDAEVHLRQAALGQLRHAERLSTIGKLASGVAHELATPLHVITLRAELMRRAVDPSAHPRNLDTIVEQTKRMGTIVRQLLEFARRGGTSTQREDVRALCAVTADLLAPLAKQSNIEISVAGDSAFAAVNPTEMQQVLSNLVSNAMAAMPDGGRVDIQTCVDELAIGESGDRRPRTYAVIEVRDQGTGIPPEVLPHVFEPFFTTKPSGQGTGLGLSVSYGIVRDHGGAMRVRTALGRGTSMLVYLPVAARS